MADYNEMKEAALIDSLNERIKELTCLYEISTLASQHENSIEDALSAIINRLPNAWKHPNAAIAELKLENTQYISTNLPKKTVSQIAPITINGGQYGVLKMHYPAETYKASDFLSEEQDLLKKVAEEISAIVERADRKKNEELLERSVRRNDRLAILGEITAGIAHELNTPLGNILGFAQLIKEKTTETQVRKDSEKIINSAIYAREVVKKLMFFSCEMPQHMESVAINEIVRDALKLLKPTLFNAGVELDFVEDPKNSFGRFDPIQITQVIFNLVINAIYASPKGSVISVKLLCENNNLNITVADQGKGIPAEVQEKIFEPFFSSKPMGEGSGLGLSVVHGIVKSHRGAIYFSTEENKGTTFNVNLPLR